MARTVDALKQIVEIRNRRETPFVAMQPNDEIDRCRINPEKRKEIFEATQSLIQFDALETHEERDNDCCRSGE